MHSFCMIVYGENMLFVLLPFDIPFYKLNILYLKPILCKLKSNFAFKYKIISKHE